MATSTDMADRIRGAMAYLIPKMTPDDVYALGMMVGDLSVRVPGTDEAAVYAAVRDGRERAEV